MSNHHAITLYGAVTKVPGGTRESSFNQRARQIFDRVMFRLGNTHPIDYKHYIHPGTYNLGDHAIAVAVAQQIKACSNRAVIHSVRWGRHEQLTRQAPIVFAGSGYYFIESSKIPAHRIHQDVDFIQQREIPCFYYGVGVNFVGSDTGLTLEDIPDAGQQALAKSLALATTISVRDVTSRNILQPLTAKEIAVTGDPALFIKSRNIPVRTPSRAARHMAVGINIPFHGPGANARVAKDLKAYIAFFHSLQKSTGCDFIQTVHFQNEALLGKIMQDHGVRLTQCVGDVQNLLDAYQAMDFHIGGMLHSCILAASVGTPCIGLAYDIKHHGFFNLLEQPDLCIPAEPFDPERLRAACEWVIQHNEAIRTQIHVRRDELEVKSMQFLARNLETLGV